MGTQQRSRYRWHPPNSGLYQLLFLLFYGPSTVSGCIGMGSSPGSGSPTSVFSPTGGGAPRVAAAPNLALRNPIGAGNQIGGVGQVQNSQSIRALLGTRVDLAEFGSDGYNSQGGGPVPNGASLACDFEGGQQQQSCCWANVPSPSEDQIDWVLVEGKPEGPMLPRNLSTDGKYLVAYATSAAPSDEAQLSSCAIACASTPIRVKARHWQSANVLLQVCQRESFPPSLGFNPLLNCQEFPTASNMAYTELVLPKASYVDIIFVASNFIDNRGDIVFLDDIEILYDSNPPDCGAPVTSTTTTLPIALTKKTAPVAPAPKKGQNKGGGQKGQMMVTEVDSDGKELTEGEEQQRRRTEEGITAQGQAESAAAGAAGASGAASAAAAGSTDQQQVPAAAENSVTTPELATELPSSVAAPSPPPPQGSVPPSEACQKIQCSFEEGNICRFSDTFEMDSSAAGAMNGLTTRFEVVKGQFMNRVTGVKRGTEGNYYAAVFLYPRERAGLLGTIGGPVAAPLTLRFQYYEGTHGVQLKGCCGGADQCPFRSDRFVSVSDRQWRSGEFVCPRGTEKVMFLCENTRTNQGACAMDDIRVLDERGQQPLC